MTQMDTEDFLYKDLGYEIIGSAMNVHNTLGPGFLEKVYENSLIVALENKGIAATQQTPIKVKFQQQVVGEYFADILVEEKIILELKTSSFIGDEHRAQILNYLKATGLKVGYILNFGGPKLKYERFIC